MITFRFSLKRNFCNSKSKKPEVLRLYKRIIRTGKEWPIPVESEYILNEARTLFKKNKNLKDEKEINQKIFEAEARLELGVHYKNPYPRLFNAPPKTTPMELDEKKIKPNYMHSYDD